MAVELCLQEEGGRVKERDCEEKQHLGSTDLQEGPGKENTIFRISYWE